MALVQAAHFLLVDDDPIFLAVTEIVVSSLGNHRVVTAATGVEGIAALSRSSEPFDYIILDLNMPGLDGLAFLREISRLGFKGRVVISSGEAESVLRSAKFMGELLGVRIIGAIKKPLSATALATLLSGTPVEEQSAPRAMRIAPTCSLASLELVPYYQPQHDARIGSIRGLEALIRVRTPDDQIHGPGKLFGHIHDHSELVMITLAIATKVLDDMRRWHRENICCRTSINLDAAVAEDSNVGQALVSMVKERGIPPELVCLELTETALPRDVTLLIEALARFRLAGFHVSLDDYGTGGSNFELLRLCPFTELKIDGSVLRSAATEPIARQFVESAVAMAAELSMEVVGEGVETEAQLQFARRCGIDIIQGFLFSVPVPADDIRNLLGRNPGGRLTA